MSQRRDLVEVTRQMLIDNWPPTGLERLALGVELQANPATLMRIMKGKTPTPNGPLCQRIYEHYAEKPLLSA